MKLLNKISVSNLNIFDLINSLEGLIKVWNSPEGRIDRIIFCNIGSAINFLQNLSTFPWSKETLPLICCGVDTSFKLQPILDLFGSFKKDLKIEILLQNNLEELKTGQIFLQDKLSEYQLINNPRCSLIHTHYEINFNQQTQNKKRNRKPPAEFQRYLKKSCPQYYPSIIGNEYFGRDIFKSFISLLNASSNPSQIRSLYPPSPMKYYQLIEDGEIEVRFPFYLPFIELVKWISCFKSMANELYKFVKMIRLRLIHESWEIENFDSNPSYYKNAGNDQFYLTLNDYEFLFQQKCYSLLKTIDEEKNLMSFFFSLTSPIEDMDSRIIYLKSLNLGEIDLR